MPKGQFQFRQFTIRQDRCLMKVGTDGVLLGAWADVAGATTILDMGAGTGLIALMAAQRAPRARIDAVELDPESASQAAENVASSPWSERVQVVQMAIQDFKPSEGQVYDRILSNPPFFSGALQSPHRGRNQVRHTDSLPFPELLRSVDRLLAPDGRLNLILPLAEARNFEALALGFHLFLTRLREVAARPCKPVERVLLEFARSTHPPLREPLLILHADASNQRSPDYEELTKAYYLKSEE